MLVVAAPKIRAQEHYVGCRSETLPLASPHMPNGPLKKASEFFMVCCYLSRTALLNI